jgi:hypothetical protein
LLDHKKKQNISQVIAQKSKEEIMEESEKKLDVAELTTEGTDITESTPEENVETNEQELEFTDNSDKEKPEEPKSEEKKQSEEENSKYAQARRKAEAETEAKVKEAYRKGRLEAFVGKTNPYTNTKIQDETDIQMYQNMYELESAGKDPVADYALYIVDKQRQERKELEEKQKLEKEAETDIADFTLKYPDVNLTELLNDDTFKDYIDGKRKPLTELYENYKKMETNFRNKAVEVAKQTIANSQSTPGSLGSGSDVSIDYNNMSKEEFEKYVVRAKNGEL